jgi:branched-chain amino acid transport system permease protein
MNVRAAALLALFAFSLVAPHFFYPVLLMSIMCSVIFASSFNILLGYAGLFSAGHAMFFGLAAYTCGYLLKSGCSLEVGVFGGVAAATLLGAVIGKPALRRDGIQFAMITLAFSQLVYFVLLQAPFTHGEDGMQGIPRARLIGWIAVGDNITFYYVTLAVTIAAIAIVYRIVRSPFGEILTAIRDNEVRVESLGFKPENFKLLAFTLSAALAGLAGAMKAVVFQFVTLVDASWSVSGQVILMTLLGGLGTLSGPMFGAAIVVLLNNYFAAFGEWALVFQGLFLLTVLIFFRRGLVGEASALLRLLTRVRRPRANELPTQTPKR